MELLKTILERMAAFLRPKLSNLSSNADAMAFFSAEYKTNSSAAYEYYRRQL